MLENAGKLPADYEVDTNRYEYSSITQKEIIYFAIVMIAILVITLLVYCVIYKKSGICSIILIINKIYKCCNFNRRNKCNNNCYDN